MGAGCAIVKVTSLKCKVERKRGGAETCAHELRLVFLMKRLLVVLCVGLGLAATSCAAYYDDLGTLEKINGEMTRGDEFADMFTVDGEAFFPIGIWGASTANELVDIVNHNFNTTIAYADDKNIELAQKNNLQLFAFLSDFDLDRIVKYENVENIFCWYAIDEPDFKGITPDTINDLYVQASSVTTKPIFIPITPSGSYSEYLNGLDIISTDMYPIPDSSIVTVYKEILRAYISTGNVKPVIPFIQAFPWSGKRVPSKEEIRAMVFLSIVANAKGILYFAYRCTTCNENVWLLPDHDELWTNIKKNNYEIDTIKNYLLYGKNISAEVIINNFHIKYLFKKHDEKRLLILVNSSEKEQSVAVSFEKNIIKAEDLINKVFITFPKSKLHLNLKRYEVKIFELNQNP